MAYKFQIGSATLSGSLVQEGDLYVSSSHGSGDAKNLDVQGSIKLDGTQVLNTDRDLVNLVNVDGTGDLTMGTITMTGFAVDSAGRTALTSLKVDDGSTIGPDSVGDLITLAADGDITIKSGGYDFNIASHNGTNGLALGGTVVGAAAADLNLAQGMSSNMGTAIANAFVALDGNKDVSGLRNVGAAQLTTSGRVLVDDTTEASTTTDGSLQTDGGLSVAKSAVIGDDVDLLSDGAILNFGADKEVNLTHVHGKGLLLNGTMELQFGASTTKIYQESAGTLEIEADGEVALMSPVVDFPEDGAILKFGDDSDVQLTHIPDTGLRLNAGMGLSFRDGAINVCSDADGYLDIGADTQVRIASALSGSGNFAMGGTVQFDGVADNAMVITDSIYYYDATDDKMKKDLASDVRNLYFSAVSGDATIAAGGALTIAADAVESGMLNDNVISGQTELAHADIVDADELMISDGGTLKKVGVDSIRDHFFGVISGDATVADGGALTIANDAVEQAMIADDAVGADQLASDAVVNASVVDGAIKADKLDIDGSTDIGADLVDADLVIVDDGAGGTNRKSALSRVKKYIFGAASGDVTATAAGVMTIAASAVHAGMLNDDVISGQTELGEGGLVAADELMISDGGTLKKIGVDNLFMNGPALLTETAMVVADDYVMFLDGGATGDAKKEKWADLVELMAGAGLNASNGQLSTQAGSVAVVANGGTLAEGYNYLADISSDATVSLPASPSVGDVVHVKAADLNSGANVIIQKNASAGSHTIDDDHSTVRIESSFGAVSLVYVVANKWRIV